MEDPGNTTSLRSFGSATQWVPTWSHCFLLPVQFDDVNAQKLPFHPIYYRRLWGDALCNLIDTQMIGYCLPRSDGVRTVDNGLRQIELIKYLLSIANKTTSVIGDLSFSIVHVTILNIQISENAKAQKMSRFAVWISMQLNFSIDWALCIMLWSKQSGKISDTEFKTRNLFDKNIVDGGVAVKDALWWNIARARRQRWSRRRWPWPWPLRSETRRRESRN
jgi:hypothetical protein